MSDGSYTYLNYANGRPTITKVNDLSGDTISEASLTFVDLPCTSSRCGASLEAIAQTLDGFVLVGWVRDGYEGFAKGLVVKVNMEGQVVWSKLFSRNNYSYYFLSVIPTADGGFIVSGGFFLTKFTPHGNVQWSKSFQTVSSPFFQSIPTLDGGVILAAYPTVIDGQSKGANVIKMNGSGNLVWAVTLEMEEELLVHSLTTLSDQGYLLAARATDSNKLFLVRLNADGTFHSNAAYSLKVPDFWAYSLAQTPDGGIAIAGELLKKTGSRYDSFLLKINDRYQLTVKKRLGFPDSEETITSVIAKKDGSYLLFGSSDTDTLFVGLESNGLASGCDFSYDLNASKVLFGNFSHKSLTITPKNFSFPPGKSVNVTSQRLNREISNVCAN